uniref:Ovule protein n=1 Tax=Ascaris lumbricoides TaxID=6252 RepID=A0A0M3HV20_ASCLU
MTQMHLQLIVAEMQRSGTKGCQIGMAQRKRLEKKCSKDLTPLHQRFARYEIFTLYVFNSFMSHKTSQLFCYGKAIGVNKVIADKEF